MENAFASSGGSDYLSGNISETTTTSEDGHTFSYRIPARVRKRFVHPQVVNPVCCEIITHIMNQELEWTNRMTKVEGTLKMFVEGLDYDQFYVSIVDFLMWTRTLDSFFYKRQIDKNHITWIVRELLRAVDKETQNNRDPEKLKEIIADQMDNRVNCFNDFFDAVFPSKGYDEFRFNLCSTQVFNMFANFLFKKLPTDTGRALTWIQKLQLYKYIRNFDIKDPVYHALTNRENNALLELCQSDESKRLAHDVVTFLDNIVGASFPIIDPEHVVLEPTSENDALKSREKEIINMAFKYCKTFQLNKSTVRNCIFVRQMKAFISAFREFNNSETCSELELFHQKVYHIMTEGGSRAQSAILTYLHNHGATDVAYAMILKLDISEEDWPPNLKFSNEVIEKVKAQLAKSDKAVREEQAKIKDGFPLLKNNLHPVRLIDTEEAVDEVLKPFIEDPANEYFGIDAEWDMSFSGEMGTLCLIQMTSETKTMLIDIHKFRTLFRWSQTRFLDLFKLIFDHSKKVYGFALVSDLKTIESNFPLFGTELLPKLSNLICLHVAAQTIRGDIDLCKTVFGENPPEDLNLSALAFHILKIRLDKVEQSSVWSYRPLRQKQQKYAAMDSHVVVEITKRFIKVINEKCPEKLNVAFVPWVQPPESGTADPNFPVNANKRKTKCNQFTEDELKEIIKTVNHRLENAPVALEQFTYITDTMCDPLGGCLRRIGISVLPGKSEADVSEQANNMPNSKILTTGKACKKYKFPGRVINVNTALSLDHQLSWFLFEERIYIDTETIKPRCIKCNEDKMIYLPELCIRYLHYQMIIRKSLDDKITVNDLTELESAMEKSKPLTHSGHYCIISKGEWGLTAILPEAVIYFDNICMQQRKNRVVIDPQSSIKLQLAMHRLGEEYDKNLLYAICLNCGKENVECSISL